MSNLQSRLDLMLLLNNQDMSQLAVMRETDWPSLSCLSECFPGPVKAFKGDTAKDPIFIDVGLYGYSPKPSFDAKAALRNMEKFARDNDGYQVWMTVL